MQRRAASFWRSRTTAGSSAKRADFAKVLDVLRKVDYRGWVALEYEDEQDPKKAVPPIIEQLQKLIA
jgi:hypothetical protein